jgi:hypothetical protein
MNKHFILFLWVLLISIQLNAQPSYDQNWNTTTLEFFDNFNPPRSAWNQTNWIDSTLDNKWKAHLAGTVTHGDRELQVYQPEYTIFNSSDSTMKLKAVYAGGMINIYSYSIANNMKRRLTDDTLYYYSGALSAISTSDKFKYGYFETRCKLPVNRGAFPAFWLWTYDTAIKNYREIDIFEYSWTFGGSPRCYEGQIYYYNGPSPSNPLNFRYGNFHYVYSSNEPDLTNWHKFGMEWSPKRVAWYFDDKQVGCYIGDSTPSLPMTILVNNAVDTWAYDINKNPISTGFPDSMIIDYVKVYKLKKACSTSQTIQNNSQFASFNYKVYNTITIGGYGYDITIPSNSRTVFRATNNITINGNFSLPLGSTLELITQPCPD